MAVSTTIDTTNGVVTAIDSNGAGSVGFSPFPVASIKALVSASTGNLTLAAKDAGVLTLSGSAITVVTMPLASACPGAFFTIRTTSNHAHILTGSQETNGTKVFSLLASGSATNFNGSAITFPLAGAAGAATGGGPSVAMISDGKNFLIIGASGSAQVMLSGT